MKKVLCLLLSLLILLTAFTAAAEETETISYLYTFTPGPLLQGEGMETVMELMGALQLRYIRQRGTGERAAQVAILSYGDVVFNLAARQSEDGAYRITCSLLGDNVLLCKREQLGTFMLTLVQMLANLNVLKGENLDKMNAMALRLANRLDGLLNPAEPTGGEGGLNLAPYMAILAEKASASEEREPSEQEKAQLGAVKMTVYRLDETTRRELVELGIEKLLKAPVIGSQLKAGTLMVGQKPLTTDDIRKMFIDPPGETTVELLTDAEDRPVRMTLYTPDLSEQTGDTALAGVRGLEIEIRREEGENGASSSITTLRAPGLEGDLVSIRMDRSPSEPLPPVKEKKVHNVGEMDSDQLLKLVESMKLVILKNAGNLIMDLPRCVFDLLGSKLFGK